jgi:hypothetical protein
MSHEVTERGPDKRNGIPVPDEESLLTPEDVARRFQVPVTWVYGCCRPRAKNRMPFIKIGHYLRFEEEAVRLYIQKQKKGYSSSLPSN